MSQHTVPPPPVRHPVHGAVLCALTIEADPIVKLMSRKIRITGAGWSAYIGTFETRRIAVAVSTPGPQAAAKAAQAIILGHRPQWILSTGLAGSLRADVQVGDICLPESVRNEAGETQKLSAWPDLSTLGSLTLPPAARLGQLLTVDRPILTASEKHAWGEKTGCLAVEMETFTVAEVCQSANVPLYAARVISDALDRDLPGEIGHLMRQKSRAGQWGAVLGSLWRRPSAMQEFWRLFQDSSSAAERLAKFIGQIIQFLP